MPRHNGKHAKAMKKKHGTNNAKQAAARDERRAAAIATVDQMGDEALEDLLSPQPAPQEEVESPATEPTYEPSKGTMDARRREAIVLKYEMLGCPPESEWGKHGGTLRQFWHVYEVHRPNMGTFSSGPFRA